MRYISRTLLVEPDSNHVRAIERHAEGLQRRWCGEVSRGNRQSPILTGFGSAQLPNRPER